MKTFLSGLVMVVLMVGFSSCQKEVDGTLDDRTQSGNTILWKYKEIDTTLPAGLDTISVYTFDYDNSGRLLHENIVSKDMSTPPSALFPYFKKHTCYYNNIDTLPYKVITSYLDVFSDGNDTTYLFYLNGIVIRDSTRRRYVDPVGDIYESIVVNRFVNNGSNIVATYYRSETLSPSTWPPPCPGTATYQKAYVNGNITSEIGNFSSCTGIGTSEFSAVYDNHPNPGFSIGIPYPVMDGILPRSQKNNIVETGSIGGGDLYRFSYTYRSDGYPLVVRIQEVADPTNAWKVIYEYK